MSWLSNESSSRAAERCPLQGLILYLACLSLHCFAYIITLSISLLHDQGLQYCRKRGRYWFLCWICGIFFYGWRALTSVFWGVVADRYGRKPIILIGTFSVVVFNALFGLSTNFWMAVSMRFLLGCFNSLLGTIRAYASEVCREEYQALALSVVSTSRGIGLIIGPAIGGFLAQPAQLYPSVFSESSIFGRFPYFLPCLTISVYAVGVLIACWWLPNFLMFWMAVELTFCKETGPPKSVVRLKKRTEIITC